MSNPTSSETPAKRGLITRAVEVALDPSPSQERLLRSYAGSMRTAYNWAIGEVADNLRSRRDECAAGVPEDELAPAMSWSRNALHQQWRATRDEIHPWHREVSIHAFRTGLDNAALALKNFSESRSGKRRGQLVGFPRFKDRHSRQAITFVELAEGVDHHHWINEQTCRHVRLMLPRRAPDGTWERRHTRPASEQATGRDRRNELAWIRAHEGDAVAEVWALCESGEARIQAMTLKFEGGRWKAVFRLRVFVDSSNPTGRLRNPGEPVAWHGGAVGVDLGLTHLATLDRPVAGLTDEHGHVPNPRVLERHLTRLHRLDRAIARCEKGSNNRARLVRRRAKLHGRIAATRKLYLHELTRRLAAGFDVVCIEDLQLSGMVRRKAMRLGRSVGDAGLGELVRQLEYKTAMSGATLVRVGRFYPSSRTCSACGAVRAKLALHVRVFDCDDRGVSIDRDVNAARNIRAEGLRLLRAQLPDSVGLVASIREETSNGEPRPGETLQPHGQCGDGLGSFEAASAAAARDLDERRELVAV